VSTRERRRRKSPTRRRVILGIVLLLVFAVGIAFGQALEDNPKPATTITQNQTLTVPPASTTVTVTSP
jgi:ABC-type Mn2+/Zn2+ transport system permease subunit